MKIEGHIKNEPKKDGWLKMAKSVLLFFVLLSFMAPMIANENPIYIHDGTKAYWPILSGVNWRKICANNNCKKITTLIPYSSETMDIDALRSSPSILRTDQNKSPHLLGTDGLGRDVLAALIDGSRTAIWISALAAGLAFIIGLFYGLIVGYYGQDRIQLTTMQMIFYILVTAFCLFILLFISNLQAAQMLPTMLAIGLYLLIAVTVWVMGGVLHQWGAKIGKPLEIDVDSIGMRLVDMVKALPPLFIVLVALQLLGGSSIWYLILLIAYLLWATFARHSRAEVLRLRNKPSVQSALLTGRSDFWIWRHELIPFLIRPLLVTMAFSMASAVLLEATLSFLGLGLPAEHVSWGTLINAARDQTSWWLLVFPGLCILLLIWSLQNVGRDLEQKMRFTQSMRRQK